MAATIYDIIRTEIGVLNTATSYLEFQDGVGAGGSYKANIETLKNNIFGSLAGGVDNSIQYNSGGTISGSTDFLFTGGVRTPGAFYTGTDIPNNSARLNYDGHFYATEFYANGTLLTSFTTANSAIFSLTGIGTAGSPLSLSYLGTKSSGIFYTGVVDPSSTTRLNYDGNLHATKFLAINSIDISTSSLNPNISDGASAIAYNLDTINNLTTVGAKILSLNNNSVEKFYVDKDGEVYANGVHLTGTSGTVTSVSAGGGMNFGTISTFGGVVLGTPSTIDDSSTNEVTSSSHTHTLDISLSKINDTVLTSLTNGEVLTYDSGNWVNSGITTLSLGTDGQIPFMSGNTDFDYNSNLSWNGKSLTVTSGSGNVLIGNNTGDNLTLGLNTFIGNNAGYNATSVFESVFIGSDAGYSLTTSDWNVLIGNGAGYNLNANWNVLIGYHAGYSASNAVRNVYVGYSSGENNISGITNVFIGDQSGTDSTGSYNTFLGYSSGKNNSGNYNIFIGTQSGENETGSNKLYIENSDSSLPLIYGEFDNDLVQINGELYVSGMTSGSTSDVVYFDSSNGLLTYGSESSLVTASNGLTKTINSIGIGGTLNVDTVIDTASNNLLIRDTDYLSYVDFNFTNTYDNTSITIDSYHETLDDFWSIQSNKNRIRLYHYLDTNNSHKIDVEGTNYISLSSELGGVTREVRLGSTALTYQGDYGNVYTDRTIPDWGNVKNYVSVSGGTSISFGTDGQIPFMNAGGTNFEYSGFTWNNTTKSLIVGTKASGTDYLEMQEATLSLISNNEIGVHFRTNGAADSYQYKLDGLGTTTTGNILEVAYQGDNVLNVKPTKVEVISELYVSGMTSGSTSNVVYFDDTTGLLTYGASSGGTSISFGTDDQIPFMNGTTDFSYSSNLTWNGKTLLLQDNNTNKNIYIGSSSGTVNTTGVNNTQLGYGAGSSNTDGDRNTFIGVDAGKSYVGSADVNDNVYIGYQAGYTSFDNRNVAIGSQAGYSHISSGSIFIGYQAGYNETGSNKLYIENSDSSLPLIYGEFDNDLIQINGDLYISGMTSGSTSDVVYFDSSNGLLTYGASPTGNTLEFIQFAVSDETTSLTSGTTKTTFRMPYAMALTEVRASVGTAPTGSNIIVDINEGGTTILSTKLSIDATEKTSTTATTPSVISDSSLADDAEITIDIDQIGSTIAGAGLKIMMKGNRV
jgi:hypothetical protein